MISLHHKPTKYVLRRFSLFALVLISVSVARAQTVPVGMPFFDDALHRAQLMGLVDSNVSFMIRPVQPGRALGIQNPNGLDTLLFPNDTNHYSTFTDFSFKDDKLRISLLPVYFHTRYNGHHPYGWADGPMVSAKGWQQYISAGVYAKAGPLEVQFRPELVKAQNKEFQNPPFRSRAIDFPERMGQEAYSERFMGQSFARLNVGPVTVGYSTENIWWGAGTKNAIVMSNNAPGFGHYTINTNKPVKTRIGTFEAQMVTGKLKHSGFQYPLRYTGGEWPPIAGDVVPDTSAPQFHSYFNGVTAVYQPKWTPGLFLGATRIVQVSGEPTKASDYFSVLYLSPRNEQLGSGSGALNRNQIVSLSFRYLFPKAHAEIYGEVGREDWAWDMEDFLTRPAATTAWMGGVRKLQPMPGKNRWLQVMAEVTKIQAPMDNYLQPSSLLGYSFYTNGNGVGWTNNGQVLGAGIGPGSNMFTIGATYLNGFKTFGLHFERVSYNKDLYYGAIDYLFLGGTNPYFKDISKMYTDWGFLLNHHTSYGKLFVGYNLHILRTYNFQWNYDPDGVAGDFRFPGINAWSVNLEISAVYRF